MNNYPYVAYKTYDSDDDISWLAYHPDLKGCVAQGGSCEEVVANLADARADYIQSLIDDGLPVPKPYSSPELSNSEGYWIVELR